MGLAVAQSAAAGDEYPTVLRGGEKERKFGKF